MKKFMATLVVAFFVVSLSGCGASKYTERYKDADRKGSNTSPAEVGTMPDGFSNYATKCDNGNRVYVIFHEDSAYGSIAVVPQDPSCS